MRTTLLSAVVFLGQWAMPTNAQPQAGALPAARPAAPNWSLIHPPTKRLFFFTSDPKNLGRPTVFGRPAQPAVPRSASRSYLMIDPVPRYPNQPTVKFPATSLLPKETLPPQDLWRFVKPKSPRPFFFKKP